jgi:AAA+ ATPase superfamily predicted ATPase
MEKDLNPFLTTGYKSPLYFCDREKETSLLRNHIKNNINTTVFAIRRLGKTGLIRHVFEGYKNSRNTRCIYLDILSTRNFKEFSEQLATAIYREFPENKGFGKKIFEFIRHFRPVISYDALSGQPEVHFDSSEVKKADKTVEQLFLFLDAQGVKVIFAIDEFQQILEYPEKNTEAVIRGYMQQLKNTLFIFCGSNQKMMHEIFNNSKRPFFASCRNINLDAIDEASYKKFIADMFRLRKRSIDAQSLEFALQWTLRHTFYTQVFCNHLFSLNVKHISAETAYKTAREILDQNESSYYLYRNMLTGAQWNLLIAIALETRVSRVHSKEFITSHKLGTSSMVSRGIAALLEKELIFYNASTEKPYYEVYDKFLMRWLQGKYQVAF